jgi:pseudaminic acid cytidylyltransferase
MKCIAIIPARAGSKRIPNKNIYEILGVPAIAYAISNAIQANIFSEVHVSTDSPIIASIAESHGALVGALREDELSDDYATTIEVIAAFLKSYKISNIAPDYVCCIYPVTPLLSPKRIIEGYNLLVRYQPDFTLAATPVTSHPDRNFLVEEDLQIKFESTRKSDTRTQDLQYFYQDAGQFYWAKTATWLNQASILGSICRVVALKKYEVFDVDEPADLELTEILLRNRISS